MLQDTNFRVVSSESEDEIFSLTLVLNLFSLILVRSSTFFSWSFPAFAGVLVYKPPRCVAEPCGALGASECVALCGAAEDPLRPSAEYAFSSFTLRGEEGTRDAASPIHWAHQRSVFRFSSFLSSTVCFLSVSPPSPLPESLLHSYL